MIIRKLRLDRGWSQEDLAETSGVSVRTIQRIENGGRASLETLKCLAAVFETPVPELRRAEEMADRNDSNDRNDAPGDSAPVELQEPARPAPAEAALSEEDRAALRYIKHLRKYDDWDGEREDAGDMPAPDQEAYIRRQVRRERHFWGDLISYAAVMVFLALVNLLTSPDYLWFLWAALGWGIALAFHWLDVFGPEPLRGEDWERREVMKRLERLNRR